MPDPNFVGLSDLNIISGLPGALDLKLKNEASTIYVGIEDPSRQYFLSLFDESSIWKTYNPLQFHFHAPSEHTINGKTYDLELHIVHGIQNSTSQLAVLGIFFDLAAGGSSENEFITSLFDNSSTSIDNGKTWKSESVNIKKLVEKLDKTKIINYSGSLTTPGCAEIVEWMVCNDP